MRKLLETIRKELVHARGVELAVLFGSAARGEIRPDSDVDVAVLFESEGSLTAELDIQARLSRSLGREVDLVRIDHASTLLKWRIVREGALIHEARAGVYTRFRAAAALEYIDFEPRHERASERFRRHLAGDRS